MRGAIAFRFIASVLLIGFSQVAFADETIVCGSRDYQYRLCPTRDNSAPVRLIRQLSKSKCVRGATWGTHRRGIWVDRGCRAEFSISSNRGPSDNDNWARAPRASEFTCKSANYKYRRCKVPGSGKVSLRRQLSSSPCVRGKTWGQDRKGVWVDRGCAGRFSVTGRARRDLDERVRLALDCRSKGFQYRYCPATVRGAVRLTKQYSDAPCRRGRTWGHDRLGIWVDQGCAGRFEIESGYDYDRSSDK